MKINYKKIVSSILLIVLLISFFSISNASDTFIGNIDDHLDGDNPIEDNEKKVIDTVMTVVRIVAVSVAIIMLLVLAMKYMVSAPGDRADIKKHAVPYVIGVIILFGASGVLAIIGKLSSIITEG